MNHWTRRSQWISTAVAFVAFSRLPTAYGQPAADVPAPPPATEKANESQPAGKALGGRPEPPTTQPEVEQGAEAPKAAEGVGQQAETSAQQQAGQAEAESAQQAVTVGPKDEEADKAAWQDQAGQVQEEPKLAAGASAAGTAGTEGALDADVAAGESSVAGASAAAGDEAQPSEQEPEPSWTEHIKLGGDFRYRFETIDLEDKDFRYRHRIRARPRLRATVVDGLDAVVQIGTGGVDDPVSNNQSLTGAFSSKSIWLDLGYFEWHPSFFEPLHLWGGKMKNPYYKVGKTELLWDPDLNPEGLALNLKKSWGMLEPFFTGTAFFVEEREEDDDTWLLGMQAGLKVEPLDGRLYLVAGGGYVDYTSITDREVLWDPEDSYGNSATGVDLDADGEPDVFTYDNDYNVLNGFFEIGGKVVGIPWAAFFDVAANTAAEEEKTGWLIGALVGKTEKPLDFHLRYIYREVQKDAVLGLLTDSDFIGGGTDGKGHEWNLAFQPANHVVVAFTYFYNRTPITNGKDYHRSQTDLKLKF